MAIDPKDVTEPQDSDFVLQAAAELRALKGRVNSLELELEQAIAAGDAASVQTASTALASAVTQLNQTITTVDNALTSHKAATNPHGINKAILGLDQVANFPTVTALEDSAAKNASIKAVADLKSYTDAELAGLQPVRTPFLCWQAANNQNVSEVTLAMMGWPDGATPADFLPGQYLVEVNALAGIGLGNSGMLTITDPTKIAVSCIMGGEISMNLRLIGDKIVGDKYTLSNQSSDPLYIKKIEYLTF